MKENTDKPEKLRRGLEVIVRNAKAQERLVADLLDASRIISGKLRLKMAKFRLSNAIHAAADVVRTAADAKGVLLMLELDQDPELDLAVGDPGRLQQVVWNLLMNSVRYTPPGGRVTVTSRREGSAHVVRVEDTGVGIAGEHLPHIFERFRQVDSSTTRAHGGLGLGLALVRHLVEAHGGTVEAASEGPGRGAAFTLFLPVRALNVVDSATNDAPAAEDAEDAEPASRPLRTELANVRVLLVEDDPDSRELVRVVLEDAGASVSPAGNATDALNALDSEHHRFDIIISDIGMPGVDGYALMSRIRSDGRSQSVPSIALTAYTRGDDVDRAAKAGYQKHLAKPVDAQKLVDAVRALVRPIEDASTGRERRAD